MDELKNEATFANYNVTASFPSMEAARHAIESLERSGVPGSHISLLGRQAEQAAEVRDTSERDERIMAKGMRATATGAGVGAGVGGALGFLAGAAAFGIPGIGPAIGAGIWATTLGGAAAGGGVGFTAGAMAKMKQSQAWELTLSDVGEGNVVVGVHSDDEDEVRTAIDSLKDGAPSKMRAFDAEGNQLDTPLA